MIHPDPRPIPIQEPTPPAPRSADNAPRAVKRWPAGALTATHYGRDYYEEHKAAGLDYAVCGEWQTNYAAWLTAVFQLHGRRMLDVGTACGAIPHAFTCHGVHADAIDPNEMTVGLGRLLTAEAVQHRLNFARGLFQPARKPSPDRPNAWPVPAENCRLKLHVCDAANLHPWAAPTFDFIHAHQTAEHWPPELVPRIFRELARVARPGAVLFCVLDTEELGRRQGRDLAADDPTHVCIRPMNWWHEQATLCGWRIRTEADRGPLAEHPLCYFGRLDWDWFTAERVA